MHKAGAVLISDTNTTVSCARQIDEPRLKDMVQTLFAQKSRN